MPTPTENETQAEFVSRCIPVVLDDGTTEDPQQAAAVCYSMWRESNKGEGMEHEYKTLPIIDTHIDDEDKGIVTHTVAIMGNVDLGKDIIHRGAFTKTLAERGNKLRVLDQHKTDSIMRVIGKCLQAQEVGREALPSDVLNEYPDITGALMVQTQYLMKTPEGKGGFERVKAEAIDEYSIGYDAVVFDYSTITKPDGSKETVRNLRELRLLEYSPVIWGMNPATSTLDVKAVWDTAYVNDLPDSAFLYIEPGKDKDEDGKTTPRSARHFPYRDTEGALDLPHLRNAIARIPQSNAPGLDDADKERLQNRARRMLEDAQKSDDKAGRRMRRDKAEIVKNIRALIDELAAWADYADREPESEPPDEDKDTAPADAGRVEEGTNEKAGPDTPPTLERERLALLAEIESLN